MEDDEVWLNANRDLCHGELTGIPDSGKAPSNPSAPPATHRSDVLAVTAVSCYLMCASQKSS